MNEPSYQTGNATAVSKQLVLREDADGIATLTLNRPKQRNALSRALMAALHEITSSFSKVAISFHISLPLIFLLLFLLFCFHPLTTSYNPSSFKEKFPLL